jgi:hypothetical protein
MHRWNVNIGNVLPSVVIGAPFSCPSFRKRGGPIAGGVGRAAILQIYFADYEVKCIVL